MTVSAMRVIEEGLRILDAEPLTTMSYEAYQPPQQAISVDQVQQQQSRYYQSQYTEQPQTSQYQQPVQHARLAVTAHRLPPPPPAPPAVTPHIASQALQRLVSSQLRDAGFHSAQPQALRKLELEVAAGGIPNAIFQTGSPTNELYASYQSSSDYMNELTNWRIWLTEVVR